MKRASAFIPLFLFVALSLFGAQRMGLVPGGGASIPPKGSSELPAHCMDEHAPPPTTETDYSKVLNGSPGSVTVEIDGEKISLQEAIEKGYVSISGVTTPGYGSFYARIDAVRIVNNTNKQIQVRVNEGAVLGEADHEPFLYDPTRFLNQDIPQGEVWEKQASIEGNAEYQSNLKSLGYFSGNVDGDQQATKRAISSFQKRVGLPETGKYDEDTRAAIDDLFEQELTRFEQVIEKRSLLGKEVPELNADYDDLRWTINQYCTDFQRSYGLEENGVINEITKTKLSAVEVELQAEMDQFIRVLKTLGYSNAGESSFNPLVSNFQRNNSLKPSGALDAKTREKLNHEIAYYESTFETLGFKGSQETSLEQAIFNYQSGKSIVQNGVLDKPTKAAISKEAGIFENALKSLGYANPDRAPIKNMVIDFQRERSLEPDGILDTETVKALEQDIADVNAKLDFITGEEKSRLNDKILYYQKAKGIEEGGKATKRFRAELDKDFEAGNFITSGGEVIKTEQVRIGNEKSDDFESVRCIKVQDGIYMRFSKENIRRINLLNNQLARKYAPDEIKILSLVKDTRTEKMIKDLYSKNSIIPKFSAEKLSKQLMKNSGHTVFVVGHIEGGDFVTFSSGKEMFRIGVSDLIAMGERAGVKIFPFGCSSAKYANSGLDKQVSSHADTEKLIRAIKQHEHMGGTLSGFAGEEYKIIVDERTFNKADYAQLAYFRKKGTAGVDEEGLLPAGFLLLSLFDPDDDDDK